VLEGMRRVGEEIPPVPLADVLGYRPEPGDAHAQDVFRARHELAGEIPEIGFGHRFQQNASSMIPMHTYSIALDNHAGGRRGSPFSGIMLAMSNSLSGMIKFITFLYHFMRSI